MLTKELTEVQLLQLSLLNPGQSHSFYYEDDIHQTREITISAVHSAPVGNCRDCALHLITCTFKINEESNESACLFRCDVQTNKHFIKQT